MLSCKNMIAADPAQAAIEKARAARAAGDNLSPQDKAQQKLDSLRQRLQSSKQKLENAGDDEQADKIKIALAASIELLKEKIIQAESELTEISSSPEPQAASEALDNDPAKAAIEKAMAKRAAAAAMPSLSPRQQLEKNKEAVEKRLTTAREKLAEAEAQQSDTAEILQTSVDKLATKLAKTNDELQQLTQNSGE